MAARSAPRSRSAENSDIQEILARGEPLEWTYYLLAGKFTRYLIERHGLDAYIEFYSMITREDALPEIEAAHAEQFGESLTETIVAFDAEGRGCSADRVRFKLVECGAPPIAWDGDSLLLRRALACGDADVVGPWRCGSSGSRSRDGPPVSRSTGARASIGVRARGPAICECAFAVVRFAWFAKTMDRSHS